LTSSNDSGTPRCPICSKVAAAPYAPFCSKRCADIDLHRWLSGGYAIPTDEIAGEDAETGDHRQETN
jgi:hypothetical protein